MNKDPYVVPELAFLIILDINSDICMANNDKEIKPTRQIAIIMHFLRNDEEFNLHKKVWCEGGLKLSYNGTKNDGKDDFNPILRYDMI